MTELNLEKYFESTDNKYYESSFLILVLENILRKKINEIKNDVSNAQISITKEQIIEFLENSFQKEDSELKHRIEDNKQIKSQKDNTISNKLTKQDIEKKAQEFADKMAIRRYQFDSYTLDYFNKYIVILKNKLFQLLNIIELIGTKQYDLIQNLLVELDIQLDEDGNIKKEDIIRLIKPTIQNITELDEKVTKANELSTYLTFKISLDSIYKEGLSEEEIYPTKSIFIKNLFTGYGYGNVSISSGQEQELREELKNNSKRISKILVNNNFTI